MSQAFTLTFGDCGENDSKGMEKIGNRAVTGISVAELFQAKTIIDSLGGTTEIYDLRQLLSPPDRELAHEAAVLVIRNGVNFMCHDIVEEITTMSSSWSIPIPSNYPNIMFQELAQIPMDKQRVVMRKAEIDGVKMDYTVPILQDKHARHNICIGDFDQEPEIIKGKGRVVNFSRLPAIARLRSRLGLFLGYKTAKLIGEVNHYYNLKECGINYHGDTERRIVVGVRLGSPFPLAFKWFKNTKAYSAPFEIPMLNHGDMYVMSEKAVGYDWKRHAGGLLTLRHAAGFGKFIA